MIYPGNLEEKIGFDKIRQLVASKCKGEGGEKIILTEKLQTNLENVNQKLGEVADFKKFIQERIVIKHEHYKDISKLIEALSIEGIFLSENELLTVKNSLLTTNEYLLCFLAGESNNFQYLKSKSKKVEFNPKLLQEIDKIIDEEGKVRDNASPTLKKIRKELYAIEHKSRSTLDSLLKSYKKSGFVKEDSMPTIREGRMVIPVISEYKKQVKGLLHDTSSTGLTLFIEPQILIDLNNQRKELSYQEKQEKIKILSALTDLLRHNIPQLQQANNYIAFLDATKAKAQFALEIKGIKPKIVDKPLIKWQKAFNPRLSLHNKEIGGQTIPQDIFFPPFKRIIIISGPNAGGKSVTLKTVGLVQYMLQTGYLIPIEEESTAGIFKKIFVSLGDDQSIDEGLSTYSSHLKTLRYVLENTDPETLFLIDELGSGTEPEQGGAIAEAILKELINKGGKGIITTHFENLKRYAETHENLTNASMGYDKNKLQPLYKLNIGTAGSSYALEIVKSTGFSNEIIDHIKTLIGSQKIDLEKLIKDLEQQKEEVEKEKEAIKEKREKTEENYRRYQFLSDYVETNKKRILDDAKVKAKVLIGDAQFKIEASLKKLKNPNSKEELKVEIKNLEKEKANYLEKKNPKERKRTTFIQKQEIDKKTLPKVGDTVKVREGDWTGELIELKGKKAKVLVGNITLNLAYEDLLKVKKSNKNKSAHSRTNYINLTTEKAINFSPKLDIRGKRVEEAIKDLENFIDEALLTNHKSLTIIHGKGNGILRKVVREYLLNIKEVKKMQDGHPDQGGEGMTIAALC